MTQQSIEDRVKALLVEHLGIEDPDKVKPDAELIDDLGCDSLDGIELTMALEEEFNIEIQDADVGSVLTVSDIVKLVERMAKS